MLFDQVKLALWLGVIHLNFIEVVFSSITWTYSASSEDVKLLIVIVREKGLLHRLVLSVYARLNEAYKMALCLI